MTRRPMVGVTPGLNGEETYLSIHRGVMDALLACGALPVLLPMTAREEALRDVLDAVDGVVFSGGGDVDPLLFGQLPKPGCGAISPQRDDMELTLCRLLLSRPDKAVLGICRGFQVMNIAMGGDVIQDLAADYPGAMLHRQKQPEHYPAHPVQVEPGTLLHAITGQERLMVNSLHHQAVGRMGESFEPCAKAPDGVVEAAACPSRPFFLGVQWHPERLWQTDCISRNLFLAFVQACEGE